MIFLFRACSVERARLGVALPPDLQTHRRELRRKFGTSVLRAMAGKTAHDDTGKLRRRAPGGWRFTAQMWRAVEVLSLRDDGSLFQLRHTAAA